MGCFSFECVQQVLGWFKEMCGEYILEIEEYGIFSFVYCVCCLFYLVKFYDFLYQGIFLGKFICFKGFFWLVIWLEFVGNWSQVGGIVWYGFVGMFWKVVLEKNWLEDLEYCQVIMDSWEELFGDMCQELVFIG